MRVDENDIRTDMRPTTHVEGHSLRGRVLAARKPAEAEAAEIVTKSIQKNGPGLVAMRKIEAAQFMVEQMAGNPNINFVHGGNTMNMLHHNKQ